MSVSNGDVVSSAGAALQTIDSIVAEVTEGNGVQSGAAASPVTPSSSSSRPSRRPRVGSYRESYGDVHSMEKKMLEEAIQRSLREQEQQPKHRQQPSQQQQPSPASNRSSDGHSAGNVGTDSASNARSDSAVSSNGGSAAPVKAVKAKREEKASSDNGSEGIQGLSSIDKKHDDDQQRQQQEEAAEQETGDAAAAAAAAADADADAVAECGGCGLSTTADDPIPILLCDECGAEWHQRCIQPPLLELPAEEEDWYCPSCSRKRQEKEKKRISMRNWRRAKKKEKQEKQTKQAAGAAEAAAAASSPSQEPASKRQKQIASPSTAAAAPSPAAAATPVPASSVLVPPRATVSPPDWVAGKASRQRWRRLFEHYAAHYPQASTRQILNTIQAYWGEDETAPAAESNGSRRRQSQPEQQRQDMEMASSVPSSASAPSSASSSAAAAATSSASPSTLSPSPPSSSSSSASAASAYQLSYSMHQQLTGGGSRPCASPGCGKTEDGVGSLFSVCGACLTAAYCSRACQAGHWKAGHKAECKQMAAAQAAAAVINNSGAGKLPL